MGCPSGARMQRPRTLMTDARPDTLSFVPHAAGDWSSGEAGVDVRRGPWRALSARMVSDAVCLFDVCAVFGAGLASYAYLVYLAGEPSADRGQYVLGETLAALLFLLLCQRERVYQLSRLTNLPGQLSTVARNLLLVFGILAFACFLMKISASFSRQWALLWLATASTTLALGRIAIATGVRRLIRAGYLRRRRAVIGEGPALEALLEALRGSGEEPGELVGVFSSGRAESRSGGMPGLGGVDELVTTLRSLPLDEIIVAFPEQDSNRLKPLIDRLRVLPVDIRLGLPSIASQLPVRGTGMIGSLPTIEVAVTPLEYRHILLKSTFDLSLALVLVVLLSPLFLVIALLIRLDSRGPILFVQERFGFNNRVIRVIKFRTMYVENTDPAGSIQTVRGDARITRVGRCLRAHSLDELPQLFNVLRGEMSLVGPRPHALETKAGDRLYHEVVSDYFARHRVRPGMTGWAQVHGLRGETTSLEVARQRIAYDIYYIDNWSIWLDLKILFMSIEVMFGNENAF